MSERIKSRFEEVLEQKRRLLKAIDERNIYKNELDSFSKGLIIPIFLLVLVVSLSLIGLLLVGKDIRAIMDGLDVGGLIVWYIILVGIISSITLVINICLSIRNIRKFLYRDNEDHTS